MTDEPLDVEAQRGAGRPDDQEQTPQNVEAQRGGGRADDQEQTAQTVEAQRGGGRPDGREQTAQDGEGRENKGSPGQPWGPDEQRYSDRPEQGGRTPGPADGPAGEAVPGGGGQ